MHDALEELCDRLLRSADEPGTGGTPATVIVTIDWDDLLRRTGFGMTSDGTLIRTAEVLRLANEAEIVPTVMTRSGAVLDLGRTRAHRQPFADLRAHCPGRRMLISWLRPGSGMVRAAPYPGMD